MDSNYRSERFADVFASVRRAPASMLERVHEIDGVGVVEARIVQPIRISWPDSDLPIAGRIISIPTNDQPQLNRLSLVEGQWLTPSSRNEAIINAAFAKARGVRPGDTIDVMLDTSLNRIERADAFVVYTAPTTDRSVRELRQIPGVVLAEGQRQTPARLRAGHRTYRIAIAGLPADSQLKVPRTGDLDPIAIPENGVMLSRALAGAVLAGVAYVVFRPRPVLVETAVVVEAPFTALIEEDGRTRVRDRYIVSAPISGRLARPLLRAGDKVERNAALAYITPNPAPLIDARVREELQERIGAAEASVEEAIALEDRARVLHARAKTDLDRTRQLRERGVTAAAALERDTFTLQSAERDVVASEQRRHVAEHTLLQARAALARSGEAGQGERFTVLAPIDGRVLRLSQDSEAAVAIGTPLFELGETRDLEIVVDVLTSDAVAIREGAKVSIERWGGEAALDDVVRRIERSGFTKVSALGVEEQRVWVVVEITSPSAQWTTLGDGFRVVARIVVDSIEKAIVVPVGALYRQKDKWHVFVVENGIAHARPIELTRRSGRLAAVASGLSPASVVVIYPPTTLTDGARIAVR
jgi:HlyD family secretion protein